MMNKWKHGYTPQTSAGVCLAALLLQFVSGDT